MKLRCAWAVEVTATVLVVAMSAGCTGPGPWVTTSVPTAEVRAAANAQALKVLQDGTMVMATESAVATDKAACLHGSRVPPGSVTGQCDDVKVDSGFVVFNKAVLSQDEQALRSTESELSGSTPKGTPIRSRGD